VLDVAATSEIAEVAHDRGARVHLDGARLANAAVALGVPLAALAAPVDTVALSLNKGLCSPFGALLAGTGATIADARVELKRLGGATVHRAGMLAAAGIVALDSMIERLADDHRRARTLGGLLRERGVRLDPERVETNIVNALPGRPAPGVLKELAARGVLALSLDGRGLRLVTHRLIGDEEVERAAYAIAEVALATSGR
jgi:threonine aldolase